jgi:hypothetical protein
MGGSRLVGFYTPVFYSWCSIPSSCGLGKEKKRSGIGKTLYKDTRKL